MLWPVLLLILKLLHMLPHISTTLSNRLAVQMNYNGILNFTFTTPLKLFSKPPKFTFPIQKNLWVFLFTLAAEGNLSFKCLSWFPYIILS